LQLASTSSHNHLENSYNNVANFLEFKQIIGRQYLHPQCGIPFVYQTINFPQCSNLMLLEEESRKLLNQGECHENSKKEIENVC